MAASPERRPFSFLPEKLKAILMLTAPRPGEGKASWEKKIATMEKRGEEGIPRDSPDSGHFHLVKQASELLSSSHDITSILDRLMDEVIGVIRAERGFILMRGAVEEKWQFITARGIDSGELESENFRVSKTIVEHVARDGRAIMASDALSDRRFEGRGSITQYGLRSILCVPLIIHGRTLGVIYADHLIETCVFGKKEKELLECIARQAAIAIENARLYEKMKSIYEESLEQARREIKETQAQLFQASKMAAVGQLAAGVAHEINNPLGAIEITVSSLRRQSCTGDLAERLETIEEGVQRCREIVGKLLGFARPEGGEAFELTDINVPLRGALSLIEDMLEKEGITVQKNLGGGLFVKARRGGLSQAFLNVLLNAKDALRELQGDAARQVRVRTWKEGRQVHCEISDNGAGMDEKTAERIFEPFFTTKQVGEGTGLGLAVVFQIVKSNGGKVSVSSREGNGAAFHFEFPEAG
ncbi:MAG: ATP-binding protein [Candidatus Eremiobacteraeota bacterium]|nr:ATP-binding protein [Candidatus Eremiobacteraeota bacterium]